MPGEINAIHRGALIPTPRRGWEFPRYFLSLSVWVEVLLDTFLWPAPPTAYSHRGKDWGSGYPKARMDAIRT